MNTSYPIETFTEAINISFTILINCCLRELENHSFYEGIPKYDPVLRSYMETSKHNLHLKLDFPLDHIEVYVPIRYRSETYRHLYDFPVVECDRISETVNEIDMNRLLRLITRQVNQEYPDANDIEVRKRMQLSTQKIAKFLHHFRSNGWQINKPIMSFIEAEQLFPVGHLLHPLTKGREGFTETDDLQYSPEMRAKFKLYYFLVDPSLVTEASVENISASEFAKNELLQAASENKLIRDLLIKYPQWKVIPLHPWEAEYFKKQFEYAELIDKGLLIDVGKWGRKYTATSSVRTVFNEESDYMYKFSLNVKMTGAVRVNHLHELFRGYQVSKLMHTQWGEEVRNTYPDIEFICDPAFTSIAYDGKVIDSFSTSLRYNPFKRKKNKKKNISLVASLCQDGLLGEPSRLESIVKKASAHTGNSTEETGEIWFKRYIGLLVINAVKMFNNHGIVCEWHQQNTLLQLDENYLPEKVFFRDNQSFLFRKSFEKSLNEIVPGLSEQGKMFIPDDRLFHLLLHYFLVGNVIGVINAFGINAIAKERTLIHILYNKLHDLQPEDKSGFIKFILESRYWQVKGNLLTALNNVDCCAHPTGVTPIKFSNVLHKKFFSDQLIHPRGKEIFFSRYFPKEKVVISLRPIDLETDLEMLHGWFHLEHAKKIWKMDWSLRKLETYYRTLLPGDSLYSYIGLANGKPTFNIEVYWAIRDIVGDYYNVLPTDYGTHQFIAPTDPKEKYVSPSTQCMVDYVFAQPEVGKMVGEGSVDSLASMMNKAHVGFKIEKVIEMPDKKANLNFCYREWYWSKFPQNKNIKISTDIKENKLKS